MNNTQSATSDTFEGKVLRSGAPVIVDFWAPWCGPCKAIHPILEQIANDPATGVSVVKVNVDDEPELAAKYGVRAIPTLLFFRQGSEIGRHTGLVDKSTLLGRLRVAEAAAAL